MFHEDDSVGGVAVAMTDHFYFLVARIYVYMSIRTIWTKRLVISRNTHVVVCVRAHYSHSTILFSSIFFKSKILYAVHLLYILSSLSILLAQQQLILSKIESGRDKEGVHMSKQAILNSTRYEICIKYQ